MSKTLGKSNVDGAKFGGSVLRLASPSEAAVLAAPPGADGVDGVDGATGPQGASAWTSDNTAEGPGSAAEGDFHFKEDDEQIYKKTDGSWTLIADITGAAGADGAAGAAAGFGTPSATTGTIGVTATGPDTAKIFAFSVPAGAAGADGSDGAEYTHPSHDGDDIDIDTTALTGAVVISDLDLNVTTDTSGHVTDANATIATRTLTLANLGYSGAADANNYTHPSHDGDDIDIDTTALTGAVVISDLDLNVTTDTSGHVTDANATIATRTLTLGDLGYTGEADATADQTNAEIRTAVNAAADSNVFTDANHTKLNEIELLADVTDATNVAAAGAVMESDASTASMSFVIDEDAMGSDSATKVPTQQSVKAYVDSQNHAGVTDLSVVATGDSLTVESSTGNNVALPLADGTNWGVMSDEMFGNLANTTGYNTGNETYATASASGVIELATTVEATDGTDAVRAVTPAGMKAAIDAELVSAKASWLYG